MIELKRGEVYTADRTRSGESAKGGPWQFVAVKEVLPSGKPGRKEILLWVDNKPVPIEEGGSFRLDSINSVKFASRKDNAGAWHDECNITAEITAVMGPADAVERGIDIPASRFSDLEGDDGELPF